MYNDPSSFSLRSFTLRNPHDGGCGSQIGVILYQRAFFVAKANADRCNQILERDLYPTGGMQVAWEQDTMRAYT